jgi:hypothetical protein
MRCLALAALLASLWTLPARAEQSADDATPGAADLVAGPLPESPAFVFLGASPSEVTRPTTLKNLGASLAQGIDGEGRVIQGIAFELTPAFYLMSVTLKEYRDDWSKYALSNLQLTLATIRSAGDSASTDLAFGLRMPLLDSGDPMRNKEFTDAIGDRISACAPSGPEPNAPPESVDPEAIKQCMAEAAAPVAEEWVKRHWNASALTFAAAAGVRLDNSEFTDRRWLGMQLWLHGALALGDWGQLIGQGSYLDSRTRNTEELDYKAVAFGSRLLVGGRRLNGFAETSVESRFDRSDVVKKDDARWSAGVEFLVSKNLWISTGVGSPYQALDEPDKTLVFANLRWGISSKARMGQPAGGEGDL